MAPFDGIVDVIRGGVEGMREAEGGKSWSKSVCTLQIDEEI